MQPSSRRLGEHLVERKVLSRDTLEELLVREAKEGIPFSKLLVAEELVGEKDLVAAMAAQAGIRFVDFDQTAVNPTLDRLVPTDLARRYLAVAVDVEGSDLLVAMADPTDRSALEAVEHGTGWTIRPALSVRDELQQVVAAMYGRGEPSTNGDLGVTTADSHGDGEYAPSAGMPMDLETELHINDLLIRVIELGGSDLHLTVGVHPSVRIHGDIQPLTEFPVMNGSEIRRMIYAILTQKQRERFEEELELDTSHSVPGMGRFRVNIFLQRDSMGSVMRVIPFQVVPFDQLGLPDSVLQFAQLPRGLVLVTGPTGSGKSTTLASLIDVINATRHQHIMTVEDPIEFLHDHKVALINQREVGEDTQTFAKALKHVLRQDPDVILVGEMRDLETISTALTAAETGHLVFATLHTQDAPQSVDRVIDVFPSHQQQQVRVQLASSLQGVVTQQLVPITSGRGRVVSAEVLVATPAVRNLIREGKTHQIYSAMQAGGKYGMQTMDMSLATLVKAGKISMELALEKCANEQDMRRLIGGAR
ncbi:MAG TPA: PilT/PilU family type 4a pilus ATPase [Acidimicrobiales bacterium]|nr:PilT/PilU family type 4a pilus ATPase [Acidimicrobiales bacterium]